MGYICYEGEGIYRRGDVEFINTLNRFRDGKLSEDDCPAIIGTFSSGSIILRDKSEGCIHFKMKNASRIL